MAGRRDPGTPCSGVLPCRDGLDTSLTLALAPGLVRAYAPRDADRIAGIGTGIDGDPGRASAELGRLGVDLVVARTVEAIKAATIHR